MQYWWVNQNQTFKQETAGGYMWSPKKNRGSRRNQFYDNMKLTEPGDIVFSFYRQQIPQIGIIVERAISAPKPEEFGTTGDYWGNEGWLVAVKWHPIKKPVVPKAIFDEIQPHLPEKYAPLQRDTGSGLQGVYLAHVPKPMAKVILKHANGISAEALSTEVLAETYGGEVAEAIENNIMAAIEQDTSIPETEKIELRKSRRGQGKFRKNLEAIEKGCRITRVTDGRLLIASHIKPWRACESNHERLDGNNGLLLTPTFDRLFDKGYITFDEDGSLIVSDQFDREELLRCHLPLDEKFNAGEFNEKQQKYLDYHRYSVFLG